MNIEGTVNKEQPIPLSEPEIRSVMKPCPVRDCRCLIAEDQFICNEHWRQLSWLYTRRLTNLWGMFRAGSVTAEEWQRALLPALRDLEKEKV